MVLVTTVITPPLLTIRLKKTGIGDSTLATESATSPTSAVEPSGGWLQVHDGSIVLTGSPAPQQTVTLALRAAELVTTAEPSDELIRWFGENSQIALTWTAADSEQLLDLLRDGTPKSWRFLETTGVLERCLPEVSTTISQRRSDPDSFDPFHPLRLPTVDQLHALVASPGLDPLFDGRRSTLERPRLLTTFAFLIDGADQVSDRLSLARRLCPRDLDVTEQVLSLSDDMIEALRGPDTSPPTRSLDGSLSQQVVDLAYLLSVLRLWGDTRQRQVLNRNIAPESLPQNT